MRFQKESSPPPFLNRKDQYRLLGMLGVLTIIMFGIQMAAEPANWEWFTNLDKPKNTETEYKEIDLDELDYRVIEDEVDLADDEFIATVAVNLEAENELVKLVSIDQYPEEKLKIVKDQTIGILRRERPSMDAILETIKDIDVSELQSSGSEEIGFRALNADPESYRGKLIKIEGVLRAISRFPYGDPDDESDDLWQSVIFTPDSGLQPWLVFSIDQPIGVEPNAPLERSTIVSGYFFKRMGYSTQGGANVAPLLVTRSIHLKPPIKVEKKRTDDISKYVFMVLAGIGVLFGIMIWMFARSDRRFDNSRLAEIADSRLDVSPEVAASMNDLPSRDPNLVFDDEPNTGEQTKDSP